MDTTMDEAEAAESPRAVVDRLIALLRLEQIEVDIFRGLRTHEPWVRVFGGQVVGQALMAACRTVEGARLPHSLHAYFMRPGDPSLPIVYEVYRDRDGASFSSRRVVAIQHGKPILNLAASFHIEEPGFSHQFKMPDVAGPEGLETDQDVIRRHLDQIPPERRANIFRQRPFEFHPVDPDTRFSGQGSEPRQAFWFRAGAPFEVDQTMHRVMLAYASDMMLLATSELPHGLSWLRDEVQEASLDHALWIHHDVNMQDWLLYAQDAPWSGGARGMNRGLIYTRDGKLVASVAQEGLIRPKRKDG